jgi:hypothetical protein
VELIEHVRSLDKKLARLAVPWEEWETLYRMRLQLERDALVPEDSGDLGGADTGTPVEVTVSRARPASRLDLVIGAAGAALIGLDLVLLLGNRRRTKAE